jgi:hypothetical protein
LIIVLVGPPALGGRRLRPSDLDALPWIALAGSVTRAAVDAARRELGMLSAPTLELHSVVIDEWESATALTSSTARRSFSQRWRRAASVLLRR